MLPAATSPAGAGLELWLCPKDRLLKAELSLRLDAFERGLSDDQRDDMVQEAQWLLRSCVELAEDLDANMRKLMREDSQLLDASLKSLILIILILPPILVQWIKRPFFF